MRRYGRMAGKRRDPSKEIPIHYWLVFQIKEKLKAKDWKKKELLNKLQLKYGSEEIKRSTFYRVLAEKTGVGTTKILYMVCEYLEIPIPPPAHQMQWMEIYLKYYAINSNDAESMRDRMIKWVEGRYQAAGLPVQPAELDPFTEDQAMTSK